MRRIRSTAAISATRARIRRWPASRPNVASRPSSTATTVTTKATGVRDGARRASSRCAARSTKRGCARPTFARWRSAWASRCGTNRRWRVCRRDFPTAPRSRSTCCVRSTVPSKPCTMPGACRVRHHGEVARIEVPPEISPGYRSRPPRSDRCRRARGGLSLCHARPRRLRQRRLEPDAAPRRGDFRRGQVTGRMSAGETVAPVPDAIGSILSRASALTLKDPGPTHAEIRTMIAAATRAPDHGKLQPWRFTVLEGAARDRFGDLMAASMKAREPHASDADRRASVTRSFARRRSSPWARKSCSRTRFRPSNKSSRSRPRWRT